MQFLPTLSKRKRVLQLSLMLFSLKTPHTHSQKGKIGSQGKTFPQLLLSPSVACSKISQFTLGVPVGTSSRAGPFGSFPSSEASVCQAAGENVCSVPASCPQRGASALINWSRFLPKQLLPGSAFSSQTHTHWHPRLPLPFLQKNSNLVLTLAR